MPSTSYWNDTATIRRFAPLDRDVQVDAVIIGGGNTGLSAAYLMKKAGLRVAVIERDHCACVNTGHTSAHLTHVNDLRPRQLIDQFGLDHAQAVWDAGAAAIQQIERNIQNEQINCGFARVPGYLHASLTGGDDERDDMRDQMRAVKDLGFTANYVDAVPLFHKPGIQLPNQARFHPIQYLKHLVNCIAGGGSHIFEDTQAVEIGVDSKAVKANGHTLHCNFVMIATDVPLQGSRNLISAAMFQTKITPYTSYVIGGHLPNKLLPDALFWDTSDPYYYFRIDPHGDQPYAIFGGLDHKTGQEGDSSDCFQRLEAMLMRFLPDAVVNHRWSGQVVEPVDGLPFIGEVTERQFIATGYSGNGLTFGTVAAMMACDAATGHSNPWRDLFAPDRMKLNAGNYVQENIDYAYYMVKDRLAKSEGESFSEVGRGEGKILRIDGERLAVHRDEAGRLTKLSPVCPHLGCIVHWNNTERTWDCPCHGSRFQATGEVIAGPAEDGLKSAT